MAKILRFNDATEFIKFVIERGDKGQNVIIGLGAECFSCFSSGSWIAGYFYKNGKFYDHFTIYKNPSLTHGRLGGIETCDRIIKRIREITDLYYYNQNQTKSSTKTQKNKLAELFE